MGIDTLKFCAEEELPSPERQITVMGWTNKTHSFSAKPYIPFINDVSEFSLGIQDQQTLTSQDLIALGETLRSFEFEESGYDPSTEEPTDPERSIPVNNPSPERNLYSRGPNSKQEVEDLAHLCKLYGSVGAELRYLF